MSEPTYRIIVKCREHCEHEENRFKACVYRMSDDMFLFNGYGPDDASAIYDAQGKIAKLRTAPDQTLYADAGGEIVRAPEPQSLRA